MRFHHVEGAKHHLHFCGYPNAGHDFRPQIVLTKQNLPLQFSSSSFGDFGLIGKWLSTRHPACPPTWVRPGRTDGASRPSEVGLLALSPTADGGGGEDDDHCKSRLTGGEDRDGNNKIGNSGALNPYGFKRDSRSKELMCMAAISSFVLGKSSPVHLRCSLDCLLSGS